MKYFAQETFTQIIHAESFNNLLTTLRLLVIFFLEVLTKLFIVFNISLSDISYIGITMHDTEGSDYGSWR